jgi:hypothetical protein
MGAGQIEGPVELYDVIGFYYLVAATRLRSGYSLAFTEAFRTSLGPCRGRSLIKCYKGARHLFLDR